METKRIFPEFEQNQTNKEWREVVEVDLKGKPFEKICWNTYEGFKVSPYYRKEDLENLNHLDTVPGEFPFLRGSKEKAQLNNWTVRQDFNHADVKKANSLMLEALQRGAEGVGIKLAKELRSGEKNDSNCGVVINSYEDFKALFKEVILNIIPVSFKAGISSEVILDFFLKLAEESKIDFKELKGSLDNDPLAELLIGGKFAQGEEARFKQFIRILKKTAQMKNFKGAVVATHHFSNAGASIVQEIAFALSTAVEYINQAKELNTEEVIANLGFGFSVGTSYFMEIAKFRAFRYLWSKVVSSYTNDKSLAATKIEAETSSWSETVYDANVNMLRTTTEAMAATIGGCDSLVVTPYDATYQEADSFSLRIARNQQLVLKEEGNFDKLVDPAGGSYYIESLTASLIKEAWKLFLIVEEKGGMLKAVKEGFVQTEVAKIRAEKEKKVAQARQNLVGTNHVPNADEVAPVKNFGEKIEQKLDLVKDLINDTESVEALPQLRIAEMFEALRAKTEKYTEEKGARIKVFLAKVGNKGMRKARGEFSYGFMGTAGFELVDNNGFEAVEDAVKATLEAKADIAVICSSDDDYAELAPAFTKQLKAENEKAIVVLAGYPKDIIEDLKAAGVDEFIHLKVSPLDVLTRIQTQLGM